MTLKIANRNLASSTRNLQIFSAIFGLTSFEKEKDSDRFKPSMAAITYNLSIAALFVYIFLYLEEDLRKSSGNNSISQVSGWLDLYSGIISQTAGIICNCVNVMKILEFYNGIITVDRQLVRVIKRIDYRRVYLFTLAGILIILFEFAIIFFPDYALFIGDETLLFLICSYLPLLTTGVVKLQFATCVFLILQRLNYVAFALKRLEKTIASVSIVEMAKKPYAVSQVETLHCIHNYLCKLCNIVNQLYGVQVFLMVLTTFSNCITQFYHCYTLITSGSGNIIPDFYFSLQWCAVQLLEILTLAYLCDSVHIKVNDVKLVIQRLMMIARDKELKAVLKIFCLHEMHRNVQFTACGLFTIDFAMVQMVCGMVTSYLIIMVQLDIAKSQVLIQV